MITAALILLALTLFTMTDTLQDDPS